MFQRIQRKLSRRGGSKNPTTNPDPYLNANANANTNQEVPPSRSPFGSSIKRASSIDKEGLDPNDDVGAGSSSNNYSSNNPFADPSPPTRRPEAQTNQPIYPDGPPPVYSAEPPGQSSSIPQPLPSSSNFVEDDDDQYAFLHTFDTVFLIDDSGSMAGTRWRETAEALAAIAPICTAHDADGIDLHFLNHPAAAAHRHVTDTSAVSRIFAAVQPRGGTPTGQRLAALLRPYLARYAAAPTTTKPLNLIVLTDGDPTDDVASPLVHAARALDRLDAPAWQVGVQFVQVGNDPAATAALRALDDGLAAVAGAGHGAPPLRDMVDTVPFTAHADGARLSAEGILKVVLGAVNRRLDRKAGPELYRRG